MDAGFSLSAIRHRIAEGRLHRIHRGVYAVGRPELSRLGHFMAAVLACGEGAALSHSSAAELWDVQKTGKKGPIHVTVPAARNPRGHRGIRVHRRDLSAEERTHRNGIPLTAIHTTLVDQAATISRKRLEAQVNEADALDLVDPEQLREQIQRMPPRRGIRALRDLLDEATFTLTDSELERLFLPIALKAGLPKPESQVFVNGFRVDFWWPELSLVVEADSLRYHRTPQKQLKDRLRDQAHLARGCTPLRFTHWQVAKDQRHVTDTLIAVVRNTRAA